MSLRRSLKALALAGALALPLAAGLVPLPAPAPAVAAEPGSASTLRIVAMRRLTEAQYRNAIADIFGTDIRVAGRFEPIVRTVHELIARGAREASIPPSGLENFDAMARIDNQFSGQIFRDGLVQILDAPEFSDGENVRRIVQVFEQRSLLEQVLGELAAGDDLQVMIAGDGRYAELQDISLVIGR
ncbi:MAG TPA: DUF1587 domain-containing protein, partial [Novosphingobium sp.]|nr:DUF1587 domain-containing protein [Novosphingobium sp.]